MYNARVNKSLILSETVYWRNVYDEHLKYNHLHLDDNIIRRREISNSLKRKTQENLHEKPAKLLRSQLEPNDLNVLTTQDINAIRKSDIIMFVQNRYKNYLNQQKKFKIV